MHRLLAPLVLVAIAGCANAEGEAPVALDTPTTRPAPRDDESQCLYTFVPTGTGCDGERDLECGYMQAIGSGCSNSNTTCRYTGKSEQCGPLTD